MKYLVVFAAVVAWVSADVSHVVKDESFAPVLKQSYENTPEGAYQYFYETGNGIYAQESAVLKNQNSEYPSLAVSGAYKYTAPDGTPIETSYVADEQGFKPVGSHIPVAPPVPELIARSLAYIAAHPPPVESAAKTPYKTFA